MTPTPEERIEIVARSPALVAAHDKAGWLALFTDGGLVEDPVGTPPNRRGARPAKGDDELGRFYETFIAPNQVRFEVAEDLVAGAEVVRDVLIKTVLSTGLAVEVPAHLIYEIVDEDGGMRLRRMRAIWDLRQRSAAALAAGLRGLWTLTAVSLHMFRVQGLRGMIGYTRGLVVGIFARGPRTLDRLCAAVSANDAAALSGLFADPVAIEFPVGKPCSAQGFLDALGAGASLRVSKAIPAGFMTSFRFEVEGGRGGVGFLEFDPRTKRIARARFFVRDLPGRATGGTG